MKSATPIAIAIAAGTLAHTAHASTPIESTRGTISSATTAHIYYNIATDEQIVIDINTQSTRDLSNPGETVWVADNNTPCAAFGQTSGTSVIVDNPNDYFDTGAAPDTGTQMLDWADLPTDTVVDCIQISYGTAIQDTDTNSDGVGDGVEGFGATWTFFEANNGFDDFCAFSRGIVSFRLTGLPGQIGNPGDFEVNYMTIDLNADLNTSLSFEIGDTDADPQSASIHNALAYIHDFDSDGLPDGDRDGDGLADFAYVIQFIQPGTVDTDNADGDNNDSSGVDGNPSLQDITALPLAHYRGTTVETDNGDGTFSYEVIPAAGPNAYGSEEGWDEYDANGFYDATYWMGGFTCNDPDDGAVNAFGQIALTMYGPSTLVDCGDHNGDGVLDIFDVFAFLDLYNAGDLAADYTGDGTLDIFDVFAFLDVFNAGCP